METKAELILKLNKLQEDIYLFSSLIDEVWAYHPSNPDFISPIKFYSHLEDSISSVGSDIFRVECEINSLN